MSTNQASVQEADEFDILSAIWILACNDENPLITYESIKYRLGKESYNIKGIVKRHGELFRTIGGAALLANWKQEMLQDKKLPNWIRNIQDKEARKAKIESLATSDVFRSQFRADDPSRSSLEIIDWGLQHIERLRKAGVDAREERSKRWTGIWMPLFSSIIGFTALLTGLYVQVSSIKTQKELQMQSLETQKQLKYYEVEQKPKQDGYSSLMQNLKEALESANKKDEEALDTALAKVELNYFILEPFLISESYNLRDNIWHKLKGLIEICNKIKNEPADSPNIKIYQDRFNQERDNLRFTLYSALFKYHRAPSNNSFNPTPR